MMDGPWAYLVHLLGWTLPVLAGQLWLLHRRYGAETGRVLRAILPPALVVTVWLSVADHLAIREGIWRFGDGLHLGWRIGVVPVEEVLFFLVTNLLVVVGLALLDGLGQGGRRG
jgi:lycopene cyclase domain-containing protein